MKLSFHGADRNVTGSCHLVECGRTRILIDCGLYQGASELVAENAAPFGFDAASIDCVLLTHAHLDHCGRIPLLVKRGFAGRILTTAASRELARLVLLDAARLQEEEQVRQSRQAERHGEGPSARPLYTTLDALNSFDHFGQPPVYDQPIEVAPGIRATFVDAGHILGSASILLELTEAGRRRTLLFSGDIGNSGRPLLRDPVIPSPVDVVVMESTYGDRLHRPIPESVKELYAAIRDTFERGGNVIIPTFALERAQELLYFLRVSVDEGQLPRSMQVFLDSPMAISATSIFRRHSECYDAETATLFREGHDPFGIPGLHFTRDTHESMAINRIGGGVVIMAGSGMCTGGRVRHHLKHNLWRSDASVVFVGFAAQGTLARNIIDGAKEVHLFGESIPVRARIHTINGFSAHADQAELLRWHRQLGRPERTFLVHGEAPAMATLAAQLQNTRVEMPKLHEEVVL